MTRRRRNRTDCHPRTYKFPSGEYHRDKIARKKQEELDAATKKKEVEDALFSDFFFETEPKK